MTAEEPPLNEVERRQHDYMIANGIVPDDFLLESQIAGWDERYGERLAEEEISILRALSIKAPSRYELVRSLRLFDVVQQNVQTMQEMSADRFDFKHAQFVIATDPEGFSTWLKVGDSSRGVSKDAGSSEQWREHELVIWMPSKAMDLQITAANIIATRLVPVFGTLHGMCQALSRDSTWKDVLVALRSPVMMSEEQVGECFRTQRLLEFAFATFEAGHEAGHIYFGHTGHSPLKSVFITKPENAPGRFAEEVTADAAGIMAVWDGMSENHGVSIDITWIGPIAVLAYRAGIEAAQSPDAVVAEVNYASWMFRLDSAVRAIATNLVGIPFEPDRTAVILSSIVPFAVATYEYFRTDGDLMRDRPTLGITGDELYADLVATYRNLLDRWTD